MLILSELCALLCTTVLFRVPCTYLRSSKRKGSELGGLNREGVNREVSEYGGAELKRAEQTNEPKRSELGQVCQLS